MRGLRCRGRSSARSETEVEKRMVGEARYGKERETKERGEAVETDRDGKMEGETSDKPSEFA